jgi:hypothetical protein
MFEHMDVRVRTGPLGAGSTGKYQRHDVADTGMPGTWFWLLLPKQKQPAHQEMRGIRTRMSKNNDDTEFRPRIPWPWMAAFRLNDE